MSCTVCVLLIEDMSFKTINILQWQKYSTNSFLHIVLFFGTDLPTEIERNN